MHIAIIRAFHKLKKKKKKKERKRMRMPEQTLHVRRLTWQGPICICSSYDATDTAVVGYVIQEQLITKVETDTS